MFKSRYAFHSLKLLWPQVWTKVLISSYTLIRNKMIYIKVLEKKKDRFLDWSSFLALLIVCNMLWYILIEHWRLAPHPTSCQTQFPQGKPFCAWSMNSCRRKRAAYLVEFRSSSYHTEHQMKTKNWTAEVLKMDARAKLPCWDMAPSLDVTQAGG